LRRLGGGEARGREVEFLGSGGERGISYSVGSLALAAGWLAGWLRDPPR
jgi:hypothetical protein